MATESDGPEVGGRTPRVKRGIVLALAAAVCALAWWSCRIWAHHRAGATAASVQGTASAGDPDDGDMNWPGWQLLVSSDRALQALPSPTFLSMLRRVAPARVGTLAATPLADYRYVTLRHDDGSDLRSAEMLRTACLEEIGRAHV